MNKIDTKLEQFEIEKKIAHDKYHKLKKDISILNAKLFEFKKELIKNNFAEIVYIEEQKVVTKTHALCFSKTIRDKVLRMVKTPKFTLKN